jgi:hypothetical protein
LKKIIATALLALQLFTICGHMALYQYFVYQSDKLFNYQISRNLYNVNDLVQIKVPVDMPNIQSWTCFEPIRGQVQFKNACYNYVKLKLSKDTIYLMCVPNYEKTRLINQNIINAKEIADIPVNKKDHVPFGKIAQLGTYNYPITLYKFSPPVSTLLVNNTSFYSHVAARYLSTTKQPPKMLA